MNILAGFMSFVSVEGIIGKLGIRNDGSYGSYGSYGNDEQVDGGAATLLLGIPTGLLLGEAKASVVANRAPIPLGG